MSDRSRAIVIIVAICTICFLLILAMLAIPGGPETGSEIPASQFGGRRLYIDPPEGRIVISDPSEIGLRYPWAESSAVVIAGDSSRPDVPAVFIDYPKVDSLGDFDAILDELDGEDSPAIFHTLDDRGKELTLLLAVESDTSESVSYVFIRYREYYPYYLRIRSVWEGDDTIPMSVTESIASIRVR